VVHSSAAELQRFLFDIISVRGSRMLDSTFTDTTVSVNVLIKDASLERTNNMLVRWIVKIDRLVAEIQRALMKQPESSIS
jgi:hypothetical protein